MSNYLLATPEQEELVQLIKQIAEKELAPRVEELDKAGEFPVDVFNKLADAGLYGVGIPEEFGGFGLDAVTQCLLHEELGKEKSSAFATGEGFDRSAAALRREKETCKVIIWRIARHIVQNRKLGIELFAKLIKKHHLNIGTDGHLTGSRL